jgi:hypothetical protein
MEYNLAELGLNFTINIDTTNANIDDIPQRFNGGRNPKIIHISKQKWKINGIPFTRKEEIASGTYGKIYAAKLDTNVDCVIKEQEYAGKDELVSILKEIIIQFILNKLKPDIFPKLYGIAWDRAKSYILMERVLNGKTMRNKYAGLQEEDEYMFELCIILKKIANILEPLQESIKFTHGDMNTGNVFILDNGDIKLIDFGFSSINLGNHQIVTNDYNKNYNKGKDLTILNYCSTYFAEDNTEYYIHVEPKRILQNLKTIADDTYLQYINGNIGTLYNDLDANDNLNGHPNKVLKILKNCDTLYVQSARSGSAGGRQQIISHLRSTLKKSSKAKSSTKKMNRKNSSAKLMLKSLEENYNPEKSIHTNREKFTVDTLSRLLENSYVHHIKKNAKKIAAVYKKESEESYALDLLKIMLFYDNDKFDVFISDYLKKKTLLDKQIYLYGTDPALRGRNFMYVHHNSIPNIFNKDLD